MSQHLQPSRILALACWPLVACALAAAGPATAQTEPAQLSAAVVDSLPLPPGRAVGLVWTAVDSLLVLSDVPDSLSAGGRRQVVLSYLDSHGGIRRQQDLTGTLDRGLAFDGEFLWSCGDERDGGSLLFRIEPDTCLIKASFPTPSHHPADLCWDGRHLWVADRDSGRLDRFERETEKFTREVLAPAFSPYGLAWDGRHTWVTDSGTGRLYRLLGSRREWNGTVAAADFAYRDRDVVLAWSQVGLWFVPAGASYAYLLVIQ